MQENTGANQVQQTEQPTAQPAKRAMTGVKKRQQIQDTNKKTFLWLAGSAIIVSMCIVALQFLVREFMFNQKIISAKSETNKTLENNIITADALRENINKLIADASLSKLKYEAPNIETTALNVIIDALPTEGDATNFANSLQAVVLPRSGVAIKELSTTATAESADSAAVVAPTGQATQPVTVPFSAGFTGDYAKVMAALSDISRVIRPIDLRVMAITASEGNELQVTVDGVTYYLPARTVEVRKETLKPVETKKS